ncbi:hypothetical protein G7L40_19700 [Paenibacillus polymyxa]|uniref:Uncharacterized protein n=1 Tax=Paenibacillus polymyxa TaxID=1406 RepID=A0A378Y0K4_PAEPO|nr:hypothetical protein [Paenibacillus polymyxa]MBE7896286.1 hypothetical protein [Paenibacillus polymyxa]MBG9765796.1 hypothetical protein [Paenibacillus polymyxa]MCC3256815.1 hypothetical protein [Paenibacillus polymyxa]QPK54702.1 hypothetical protein G7035_19745 [Paenibacillus polymyxa]QPK59793.1 hypothetical protein G7L40_19700 [Paenibacillus polymyxa]
MQKHLINDNGTYKTYLNGAWQTVTTSSPSKDNFVTKGMDDLSVLNRTVKTIDQPMTDNGILGSGKVFKSTLDLKKYFDITGIIIK